MRTHQRTVFPAVVGLALALVAGCGGDQSATEEVAPVEVPAPPATKTSPGVAVAAGEPAVAQIKPVQPAPKDREYPYDTCLVTGRPLETCPGKVTFVYKRYQIIVADAAAKAKFDQFAEFYAAQVRDEIGDE